MSVPLTYKVLHQQNSSFKHTGGVSQENRSEGFYPAFYDTQYQRAEVARFPDGTPAPCHLLAGVPKDWVTERDQSGKVIAVKSSVIAGFMRNGRFYTREQVSRICSEKPVAKSLEPYRPGTCEPWLSSLRTKVRKLTVHRFFQHIKLGRLATYPSYPIKASGADQDEKLREML